VSQHTVYVALGVNLEGKEPWQAGGAGGCRLVLTDSEPRFETSSACIDGLSHCRGGPRGLSEKANLSRPPRAALRYVSSEDSQAVVRDLKKIYQAATVIEAEQALDTFAQAWDEKYPTIAKMWRAKWTDIITLFDYPPAIRKAIYTTNAIESVNSVIRKFTRNRKIYPNEESALKIVFMAIREASRKWTLPIKHWKQALNHFAILFEDRLPQASSK
jgi:transposase-like protein